MGTALGEEDGELLGAAVGAAVGASDVSTIVIKKVVAGPGCPSK